MSVRQSFIIFDENLEDFSYFKSAALAVYIPKNISRPYLIAVISAPQLSGSLRVIPVFNFAENTPPPT